MGKCLCRGLPCTQLRRRNTSTPPAYRARGMGRDSGWRYSSRGRRSRHGPLFRRGTTIDTRSGGGEMPVSRSPLHSIAPEEYLDTTGIVDREGWSGRHTKPVDWFLVKRQASKMASSPPQHWAHRNEDLHPISLPTDIRPNRKL
jgi:hypothetical protein